MAAEMRGGDVPQRTLGRTGEKVSAIGLGGFHLGTIKHTKDAVALAQAAADRGVTFWDNCWDYHDGRSEELMGKALRDGYRERVFLMTKVDGRTREAAAKQIDQSLKRFGTDRIDLMQFHEVIRVEDADRIFAEGGAMAAFLEAQRAGKIRYIGFTGHKDPMIHLRMLEVAEAHGFTFDAVQMPLNVLDAHFRSFEKLVLPRLLERNIGVLGMKPLGAGKIVECGAATAVECLNYALHLPTSVVITGMESMERLEQALEAARTYAAAMTPDSVRELLARTEPFARTGRYEAFKTSTDHDGTAQNVQWLG